MSHVSADCRDVGYAALDRFYAPAGNDKGFTIATYPYAPNTALFVPGTYQGLTWQPISGYTHVTEEFIASSNFDHPAYLGALIAHEEAAHHTGLEGPLHEAGIGAAYENACGEW